MKLRLRLVRFVVIALVALTAAVQQPSAASTRVVAIGDIHGSLDGLTAILKRAGLIDENGRWTGGETTLVQTGDYTDRGPGVRGVLDLLIAVEEQASKAGGKATILLGNHEVMNLVGETRDATPEIFATFADNDSEKRREDAWQQYDELAKRRTPEGAARVAPYALSRDAWMAAHPRGYLEYRAALGPRGTYGRWLRRRAPAARVGNVAFMHAGVDPATSQLGLDEVNAKVKEEIEQFDEYVSTLVDAKLALPFFSLQEILQVTVNELTIARAKLDADQARRSAPSPTLDARGLAQAIGIVDISNWAILAGEGPMWFRGYATWPDTNTAALETILQRFKVDRLVVAHTPQANGTITSRFNGRLFLIDTGMLASVYRGRPSALEIDGTRIKALYPDAETVLVER